MNEPLVGALNNIFGEEATPMWMRESLAKYVERGVPTGDFLRAVLANDLLGAFARADLDTGRRMGAIVTYVMNHVPLAARGCDAAVCEWIAAHHERRARELEKGTSR